MFIASIVVGCLVAFAILCWLMWDEIETVVRWQRGQHDRISKLEVHEHDQDNMILSQESRIDRQQAQLKMVKQDIKVLGKDIGWSDDNTKTQLHKTKAMFPQPDPEDDPPDEAA